MVDELLEPDENESLEEKVMELNQRKNMLDRDHREELRDYELAVNKLVNHPSSDNIMDPYVALSGVKSLKEDGKLDEEHKKEFRRGSTLKALEQDIPSTREEIRESFKDLGEDEMIPDDIVEGVANAVGYYTVLANPEFRYVDDELGSEISEESKKKITSWNEKQKQVLDGYRRTVVEEAGKDPRANATVVENIIRRNTENKKYVEPLEEEESLEEIEAIEPPESVYRELCLIAVKEYEKEIQEYEEVERMEREENREDQSGESKFKFVESYDYEKLGKSYSSNERRVLKEIADLKRKGKELDRRDIDTAYQWAWSDIVDRETPELSREERSRLSGTKTEFERYLKSGDLDFSSDRRDKPDLDELLKTGEYLARKCYDEVKVEV